MSRLFDALKEANRFTQNDAGTAGEGVWEALGLNGVEGIPPSPDESNAIGLGHKPRAVAAVNDAPEASLGGDVLGTITAQQNKSYGIPAIATVDKKARLIPNTTDPIIVERYRMLRTKIVQEREKRPFRSLVIASASPQEGKTVTVFNLALSFGLLPSFRVLMVDGDMRRGTLGDYLGVDRNQLGLSNLLDGSARLEEVVLKSNEFPMHFVVRGNSLVPDLQSSHFSGHFRSMAENYDLVLVDSPPVNTVTDVQLLAASCDAVLLVARAFSTSRKSFEQAVHNLQPFRLIGSVLNAGSASLAQRYGGYYSRSRRMSQRILTKLKDYSIDPPVDFGSPVEICQLEQGGEIGWDRFVTSSPSGTFFHLSGWKTVVENTLGHQCFFLVARNDHQITGVFPICRVKNKLFGDSLVSLPLAVYGGICADDQNSYFSLLKAGSDLASRLGVKYLEMRNRKETYRSSLPGKDLYVTFTQDLSPGPDKLLQGLPRDTRYMVRKSFKAGLEWTEDLSLQEFYEIYAQSVHRLGTPVFSRGLFSLLLSEFPGKCRLFGVRKGKTAIAGALCFYFRDQVLPYYAGALPEFYKDSPNNFMYWNLISQSCREGFRHFDFGRSKRGTGSFSFKSSWGMQVDPLPYRYQLIRARQVPQLSPIDHKFQLPIFLWKRMPFAWTKVLGPRLIRWVPSV